MLKLAHLKIKGGSIIQVKKREVDVNEDNSKSSNPPNKFKLCYQVLSLFAIIYIFLIQ